MLEPLGPSDHMAGNPQELVSPRGGLGQTLRRHRNMTRTLWSSPQDQEVPPAARLGLRLCPSFMTGLLRSVQFPPPSQPPGHTALLQQSLPQGLLWGRNPA